MEHFLFQDPRANTLGYRIEFTKLTAIKLRSIGTFKDEISLFIYLFIYNLNFNY